MKIENDLGYLEGTWSGERLPLTIKSTTYGTIENAIAVKEEVIKNFETEFGYSREMDVEKFDYNYSWTVGFLDALKKAQQTQSNVTT